MSPVDPALAVHVDRELLFSAISNLLQNAFKFTEQNTEVSLNVHATADRILIEVEDSCGGFEGEAERMFRPFTQGGNDRSGLGLGLSICRRSVEANNGILSVRDMPGRVVSSPSTCHGNHRRATRAMSDAWIRGLTMSAIVLLVLHAVGSWVYSVLGLTAAIVSAALVAAVSVLSARMAALGEGNHAWFVIPTILFTTAPLAAFSVLTAEHGWWAGIGACAIPSRLRRSCPSLVDRVPGTWASRAAARPARPCRSCCGSGARSEDSVRSRVSARGPSFSGPRFAPMFPGTGAGGNRVTRLAGGASQARGQRRRRIRWRGPRLVAGSAVI